MISRFYQQFSRNGSAMAPERMFEKISNFKIMNILYIILKHVVWRFQIYNYFREIFKFRENMSKNRFREISLREVSFFIGRGGGALKIFQVLWIFSDPPYCMSEIFLIPHWGIAEFKWSPPQPHNKSGRISFCIWSWYWPSLGLVKSEGREFKRNFNSCSNKTTKFASYQYLLHDW